MVQVIATPMESRMSEGTLSREGAEKQSVTGMEENMDTVIKKRDVAGKSAEAMEGATDSIYGMVLMVGPLEKREHGLNMGWLPMWDFGEPDNLAEERVKTEH